MLQRSEKRLKLISEENINLPSDVINVISEVNSIIYNTLVKILREIEKDEPSLQTIGEFLLDFGRDMTLTTCTVVDDIRSRHKIIEILNNLFCLMAEKVPELSSTNEEEKEIFINTVIDLFQIIKHITVDGLTLVNME